MRLALLSDIHGNREALEACLAHARGQGAARYAFLGDLVGYGADPVACIERIMGLALSGAVVLRGNHDEAVLGGLIEHMNHPARDAIYWTRAQLAGDQRAFLASLPLTAEQDDVALAHASLDRPGQWTYVAGPREAADCLAATPLRLACIGHVHEPGVFYGLTVGPGQHAPVPGVPIALGRRRRWLLRVGSVGQPRDGNPAASYCLLDRAGPTATFFRVPYDAEAAAARIRAAGLPERLALRLLAGR